MKSLIAKVRSLLTAGATIVVFVTAAAAAQDPGWPRQVNKDGATLLICQPQASDWRTSSKNTPKNNKVAPVGQAHPASLQQLEATPGRA